MRTYMNAVVCSAVVAGTLMASAFVTSASSRTASSVPQGLRVMSDKGYAQPFGVDRAEAEGLTVGAPQPSPAALRADASARASHWNVVNFVSKDGAGKKCPEAVNET
ncbi:hypothetical protein ACFW9L_43385 [Streptomyces sp. NPDC059517]|uniref:hypothetical protein n=1 Tax=Streptomyces sp. NPDC059517 TaxID=3346855 RepID=UPI0036AE8CBE